MKNVLMLIVLFMAIAMFTGCEVAPASPTTDQRMATQQERTMREANSQAGLPAIVNFQEKKMMKMLYELRDQEDLVCYAYLMNERTGHVGQYLGQCIGYGLPASTQYSNPNKLGTVDGGEYGAENPYLLPQAEPNGLFMPEGLSATWLMMVDPEGNARPVYIEPAIIVSPFKLH